MAISTSREDIAGLLEIPAPTYILGIHEPSKRVFIRSVHDGIAVKAITRIPIGYELTAKNPKSFMMKLYDFGDGGGTSRPIRYFYEQYEAAGRNRGQKGRIDGRTLPAGFGGDVRFATNCRHGYRYSSPLFPTAGVE